MPARKASGVKGEAVSGIEHQSSWPVGNVSSSALNAATPFVEMGVYRAIQAKDEGVVQLFVLNRCFNQRVMMRLH